MFKVIPSLSISEGKIVVLKKGSLSNQLKYNLNPVDLAKLFESNGVDTLQFIDLDGAKKESPVNYHILEAVAHHSTLKVDFMGGIRTDGDINKVLEHGASLFTASSVAVNNQDLFTSWIMSYGRHKLSLMANISSDKLIFKEMLKPTDIHLDTHVQHFYKQGLKYIKVADMHRDGMLEGPNFELYAHLLTKFPDACIIASGGVRSLEDIRKLKEIGLYGVIVGRALYDGNVKVEDLKEFAT